MLRKQLGATVAETGVLVGLVGVAIIAASASMGGSLSKFFGATGNKLENAETQISNGTSPTPEPGAESKFEVTGFNAVPVDNQSGDVAAYRELGSDTVAVEQFFVRDPDPGVGATHTATVDVTFNEDVTVSGLNIYVDDCYVGERSLNSSFESDLRITLKDNGGLDRFFVFFNDYEVSPSEIQYGFYRGGSLVDEGPYSSTAQASSSGSVYMDVSENFVFPDPISVSSAQKMTVELVNQHKNDVSVANDQFKCAVEYQFSYQ